VITISEKGWQKSPFFTVWMIPLGVALVLDRLKGPDHLNFRVWYPLPSFGYN